MTAVWTTVDDFADVVLSIARRTPCVYFALKIAH